MWKNPLDLMLVQTDDTDSWVSMPMGVTGLPVGLHPGAYGVVRKNHVHEGVDLYTPEGSRVYAVECGIVVAILPFTGPKANLPWWLDTDCVLVEGDSGVVVYGEIVPYEDLRVGDSVLSGQLVGYVTRVLRNDRGRPMSMLHLELHTHGARRCPEWLTKDQKPATLQDPTPYLLPLTHP